MLWGYDASLFFRSKRSELLLGGLRVGRVRGVHRAAAAAAGHLVVAVVLEREALEAVGAAHDAELDQAEGEAEVLRARGEKVGLDARQAEVEGAEGTRTLLMNHRRSASMIILTIVFLTR